MLLVVTTKFPGINSRDAEEATNTTIAKKLVIWKKTHFVISLTARVNTIKHTVIFTIKFLKVDH